MAKPIFLSTLLLITTNLIIVIVNNGGCIFRSRKLTHVVFDER